MASCLHILDGGTGQLLFKRGLPDDGITWSARAIIDAKYHPMVTQCHLDFLNAGSRIITTNNYTVTPSCLTPINKHKNIAQYTKIAVDLAKDARTLFYKQHPNTQQKVFIAGSIPPLTENYRPDLILSQKECSYWYSIIINTLNENNVDIFLCETLSCFKECRYAMDIIKKLKSNKKCWISFSMNDKGLLRSKESLNDVIKALKPYFVDNNIEILSMNCSTPESIDKALQTINDESIQLLQQYEISIGCYANGFQYISDDWSLEMYKDLKTRTILTPQYYYDTFVAKWLRTYEFIGMIGGCCCMLPSHIKYIVDHIKVDFPAVNGIIENRKRLLIYGYCRRISMEEIVKDIITIILLYSKPDKIAAKYMEILCGETEHIKLGKSADSPLSMNNNITETMRYFAENTSCLNCLNIDCLKFHKSYTQQIKTGQKDTFRNNANEYKCDVCNYYIVHNIKVFVISRHIGSGESTWKYITPINTTNIEVTSNKTETNKEIRPCFECNGKNTNCLVSSFDSWEGHRSYGSDANYVVYCKECKVFSINGHHISR